MKRDFCAERLPCSDFNANALYFQLAALAYNLFALQRDVITSMHRKRVMTVRRQLYDIAAKVTRHARRLVIQLRDDHLQRLTLALKQIKGDSTASGADLNPPPIQTKNRHPMPRGEVDTQTRD